jgi:ribonuclease D
MNWIDRQEPLDRAMDQVAAQPVVAIDTEADSLHSYFDKVCLIQISIPGEDFVVDPLGKVHIEKFGKILAEPSTTKILHGGDYDLRILNRDFGFVASNIIDTMICAQLLGYEAFGLAALLDRHFGVKVNKAHQRADWAMRPLPPDMLEYAAMDTRYLIALADKLRGELETLGRWEWALEEFSRLENVRYREASEEDEAWRRMKNMGNLDRRSLAILRNLHGWRDGLARKADRPPFKIIGNDALIEIAGKKPADATELAALKAVSSYHRTRYTSEILRQVQSAMAIPEAELPERNETKPWIRDRELENRINKLKKARDKVAAELKIDSGLLAPRHVLSAVAASGSLDDIPALRNWQRKVLGHHLLDALK